MPKKSIKNLSISDYPDFIILDSTILLSVHPNFPNKDQKYIKTFLQQIHNLSYKNGLIAAAPVYVFEECYFKIIQMYIKSQKSPIGRVSWHRKYKNNPGIINGCRQEIEDFFNQLMKIPIIPITIDMMQNSRRDINLEVPMRNNIFSYSLLPKDALILAVSECLEIDSIATLDSDYLRVKNLNIFTV